MNGSAANQTAGAGNSTRLSSVSSPIPSQMDGCEAVSASIDSLLEQLEKRLFPYMSSASPEQSGRSAGEGVSDFHTRLVLHSEHLVRQRDRINTLLDRLTL